MLVKHILTPFLIVLLLYCGLYKACSQSSSATSKSLFPIVIETPSLRDTLYSWPTLANNSHNNKRRRGHRSKSINELITSCESDHSHGNYFKPRRKKSTEIVSLRIHYEIDYDTFQDMGAEVNNVTAWVLHNFQKVASIYLQHNIRLEIATIYVWDEQDIYSGLFLRQRLDAMAARLQNSYAGHTAQLITSADIGGGFGHLNTLCQPYDPTDHKGPYSIACSLDPSLDTTKHDFWNVFVMAHELGHVIGSPHTHSCSWGPNQNQPLDACFITEGDCPPFEGNSIGTIMSYCHFNYGVDFANGFGEEPGALLYDRISSSSCVQTSCPNSKNITSVPNYGGEESAYFTITSSALLPESSSVMFSANQEIVMEPGFEVRPAASLSIMLDGCFENQ